MAGILFWICVALVVYAYLGYPVLLAILARLRRRSGEFPVPAALPSVTLLIAAYNEEAVIAAKLRNSLALDYPRDRLQILVAADGSDDRTAEIVASFADSGVEMSHRPARGGKMAAINRAMAAARGEIVVFSDANNAYEPDTLRRLVAPFADPGVGAASGAKHIAAGGRGLGESEGLYWKYECFIKRQETRLSSCVGAAGEVFAIRRSLFEPPPTSTINDDFVMAMQIIRRGHRVVYVPEARSSEAVSPSATDEIARRARIVAGRYQAMLMSPRLLPLRNPLVVWQVISHKYLRPLVPLAMLGALLANVAAAVWPPAADDLALLRLAPPLATVFVALQAGFYGLAWLGRRVPHTTLIGKLLYVPTFLVDSNLAAAIGLFRFLTGRQTALWRRAPRHETTTS